MSDLVPDLARQAVGMATEKHERAAALLELIEFHLGADFAEAWFREAAVSRASAVIDKVAAGDARKIAAQRAVQLGVAAGTGRPVSPTLSVRTEHGRQLMLWQQATPRQFVEAVRTEQAVALGRLDANKPRHKLVERMLCEPALLTLPSLADVCRALGVDVVTLDLDSLPSAQ